MHLKRRWVYLAIAMVAAAPGGVWFFMGRDNKVGAEVADKSALRLEVDLSTKRLKMFEADTLVWQYPISDGAAGYRTPPGRYTIQHMVWNPRWVPPDAKWARKYSPKGPGERGNPMRVVKIFFREPAYYIHGTYETGRLGTAASHGCLRMDPEHVAEVARYIMEHGGQPRDEGWFERITHFRSQERSVYLKRSVPLTIRG